jgi:diphthamide biosynthesis protein 2
LTKRANGDLAIINGTLSPGAEYLRSKRTWQGLGSDFEIAYEEERGAAVEQGRSGVARGYTVGEDDERR